MSPAQGPYTVACDGSHYFVRDAAGRALVTCCARPEAAPVSQGPILTEAKEAAQTVADALTAGCPVEGWAIRHENAGGGCSIADASGRYIAHTARMYRGAQLVLTDEEAVSIARALVRSS